MSETTSAEAHSRWQLVVSRLRAPLPLPSISCLGPVSSVQQDPGNSAESYAWRALDTENGNRKKKSGENRDREGSWPEEREGGRENGKESILGNVFPKRDNRESRDPTTA